MKTPPPPVHEDLHRFAHGSCSCLRFLAARNILQQNKRAGKRTLTQRLHNPYGFNSHRLHQFQNPANTQIAGFFFAACNEEIVTDTK